MISYEFTQLENLPNEAELSDTTVLMPIGGQATRAQSVTEDVIPKHLIPLGEKTVLDVVCEGLQSAGFREFVFCIGHHKDQIKAHVEKSSWANKKDVSYDFSEETEPLGVDGAILHAISRLGLRGQGLIVPGDVMLPWRNVASMDRHHKSWNTDVTMGVTSYTTERTTDVGKIIVEDNTDRILWCYGRNDEPDKELKGSQALTSAAATSINMHGYADTCQAYLDDHPGHGKAPLSLRDHVMPWAARNSDFSVRAFDIKGEVLDLGTPSNIYYGQENWLRYA